MQSPEELHEFLVNWNKKLMNQALCFKEYIRGGRPDGYMGTPPHDHCVFCHKTLIDPADMNELLERQGFVTTQGYATLDNYHWVCEDCYEEYKGDFMWKVEPEK